MQVMKCKLTTHLNIVKLLNKSTLHKLSSHNFQNKYVKPNNNYSHLSKLY